MLSAFVLSLLAGSVSATPFVTNARRSTCDASFVDGLITPNPADPGFNQREFVLSVMQDEVVHAPGPFPGLPPVMSGHDTGLLLNQINLAAFAGTFINYAHSIGQMKMESFGMFAAQGVKNFSTLDAYSAAYTVFPAPPGVTNQTGTDAYFGRARLTFNPHYIKQVATSGALPFPLTDAAVKGLLDTGVTLAAAQAAGKLYVVDHSIIASMAPMIGNPGKYSSASVGLFYLNKAGALMPIAIQNRGFTKGPAAAPLVVTPNNGWDWALAKIAMSSIEVDRLAADHFIQTHIALSPITTSQYRMLASSHPVYVMLDTVLQYNVGTINFGLNVLFPPVYGAFDDIASITGSGVIQIMAAAYPTWSFYDLNPHNDLTARKLGGIPNFTWFEQATALYDAIGALMTGLVNVYYPNDAAVQADFELQGFAKDVVTNGKVAGFPSSFPSRASLAKALAHITYIICVRHHSMNSYTEGYLNVLPWAPSALYKPLPTKLGTVTAANIASWLPDVRHTMSQVADSMSFQMPIAVDQTLYWIFNGTALRSPRTQCVLDAFRASLDPIVSAVEASAAADKIVTGWNLMSPVRLPARVFI
ncbi:Mitogen-activated protein kinase 4a [Irineochytrium annulatum]|nr:Mitogen-activated protein kinase 4a [Irineochytrium annulatum]